ncbi:hypothetical protein [Candidatus Thiodictyon syntrophicum]|jgi:hypothetical protein|nr:hypothetical protein [Candidatus Thiodictyon syntrophicum]
MNEVGLYLAAVKTRLALSSKEVVPGQTLSILDLIGLIEQELGFVQP